MIKLKGTIPFLIGLLLFTGAESQAFEPLGVPDPETIEYPDEDPPSQELVLLGKTLFFDNRLSLNDNQSCATCHNPDLGFGEGVKAALGTMGKPVGRNTPHLYNLAWNVTFFWDGRASSLEEQALGPIEAEGEMNLPLAKLEKKLDAVPYYNRVFNLLFPEEGVTRGNIGKAIAAYERTLIIKNTPFDRYIQGDVAAISDSAIRGLKLFEGKGNCAVCHMGPNLTDNGFHNIGIDNGDIGRDKIQKGVTNKAAFKTPGLRNVLLTAPYMHDGSLGSLEEVLKHYNVGGLPAKNLDPLMKPLGLTDQEIFDIIAFMGSLTEPMVVERPQIP